MVTYAIGAEKFGEPLLFVQGTKKAYPFPKGLHIAPFKTKRAAYEYMTHHTTKLQKLVGEDYTLVIIRVDAPFVLKGRYTPA